MRIGPSRHCGFTIIELMVTLVVASILITVAVPGFNTFLANHRVQSAGQELMATLAYARSEAVRQNASVRVQPLADDWSDGWEVIDADGQVLRVTQGDRLTDVNIGTTDTVLQVEFQRSGRAEESATFTACDQHGRAAQRVINVSLNGRSRVTVEETCP